MIIYPRLIYDNFWRKGTMLTPSSEDAKHPATDTQIDTLSMYWKAAVKNEAVTLPNNLGEEREINSVAILGHNIESSGVVIALEGADDAAFAGSDLVTRILTYNATNIFQYFTAFTKSHVRLRLTKAGGDFTDYPQVATIQCGNYSEFNRRPISGHTPGKDDITEISESDARAVFAQEKVILDTNRYIFEGLDDVTKDIILALLEECGVHKAFIWCTDYSAANTSSLWVRNPELISPVFQSPNFWNWEIMMKEVK